MWREKGEDMPVALAFGVPPACAVQAGARAPDWEDEYDWASKLVDAPIDMVKCETNDIMVPAQSEIIVEGVVSITETCLEGPFGEWAGYIQGSKVTARPKMTVTAVTFRDNAILPISSPGVPPDSTQISISFTGCANYIMRLKEEGFPVIDGLQTFESAGHWFVVRVKNNWHQLTGWRHNEFMEKLAHFIWTDHIGYGIGKIILVGEDDVDPSDLLAVTWAFASRNHPDPGMGFFQYPDLMAFGFGVDGYHSREDCHSGKGGYGIYSCLGLEEVTGLPKPGILTFNRGWPKAVKEKVLANWDKWGMNTPDPDLMKHATPPTPWAYFETTGEGETGRGENL